MLPAIRIVVKIKPKGYPEGFNHIGDHIRAKRLTDGLGLKKLAVRLNTTAESLCSWERGRNAPTTTSIKYIIDYLGYCPLLERPKSLGQQVRLKRIYEGLTSKQLARKVGIDQTTLLRWEGRETNPKQESILDAFEIYLNY